MSGSHSEIQHTRTTVLWPWRTLHGEGDNALFCMTNLTACCHGDNNGRSALGNRKLVRFLQNQRTDGAWYICTAGEVEKVELPLWDTWCNACCPDHIHWSVLSNHWWVTVVTLQKVRFKHDRVYRMCQTCTNVNLQWLLSVVFALRCYHIVYVSIHSMTTLRREDMWNFKDQELWIQATWTFVWKR